MQDFIKRFFDWFYLKVKINEKESKPPYFKEGEIWWCHLGENIGTEMRGKGKEFSRPIFVYKKYDSYSFLGLPLTSKIKRGSWYVNLLFLGKAQTIIISQGKVLHYKRLMQKMGQLENIDTEKVIVAFEALHIKNKPLTGR